MIGNIIYIITRVLRERRRVCEWWECFGRNGERERERGTEWATERRQNGTWKIFGMFSELAETRRVVCVRARAWGGRRRVTVADGLRRRVSAGARVRSPLTVLTPGSARRECRPDVRGRLVVDALPSAALRALAPVPLAGGSSADTPTDALRAVAAAATVVAAAGAAIYGPSPRRTVGIPLGHGSRCCRHCRYECRWRSRPAFPRLRSPLDRVTRMSRSVITIFLSASHGIENIEITKTNNLFDK